MSAPASGTDRSPETTVVDLHAHSRFFHRPPEQLAGYDSLGVAMATGVGRLRGVDRVALTNHNFHRPELQTERTLPGIEVSTTAGHVLVVGPDPPERTEPGTLTPAETVAVAHDRGCAAIVAHPFRHSTVAESGADFDAVELNGKRPERRDRVEALASELGLPVVGGSDAHLPVEVGRVATVVGAADPTPEAVVAAIRRGEVAPVERRSPVDRAIQLSYRGYHGLQGQ